MLLIMSSVISDQKHEHVVLLLIGKARTDSEEFTTSRATWCHLRTFKGSRVYAPIGIQ